MDSQQKSSFLSSPNPQNLFILDIDSTLVTTHQRNQVILDQFLQDQRDKFPQECQALSAVECQLGDYGLESGLNRVNFATDHKNFEELLFSFWRDKFFSNEYLYADQPTPGAVEWVNMLQQKNLSFIYLTARHHDQMWDGTLESMSKLGFPISSDILFLKKDLAQTDEQYKSTLIDDIGRSNPDKQLCLIDNEPVVLNKILIDHPEVKLVWFKSTHSGRMQPPKPVNFISDFNY